MSVQEPDPTWGSILLDVQNSIFIFPFIAVPIGVVLLSTVCVFIGFSDTVHRLYDTKSDR